VRTPQAARAKSKASTVFLDVDGVLADWCHAACKVLGIHRQQAIDATGQQFVDRASELWSVLTEDAYSIYSNLPVLDNAHYLYDFCLANFNEVFFLTATPFTAAGEVMRGKMTWLERFTGDKRIALKTIICPTEAKQYCAAPDRILVDDREKALKGWRAQGGIEVKWPEAVELGREVTEKDFSEAFRKLRRYAS